MKKQLFLLVAVCCVGFAGCASTNTSPQKASISKIIQDFSDGADKREVERVASAFYNKSNQFFMSKGNVVKLPMKQYLALLKNKKIGGVKRKLVIHSIDVTGEIASAKVTMHGAKYRFDNYITFMKVSGKWKIVNNVLKLTKKG